MQKEPALLDFRDYPEINCTSMADCYTIGSLIRFVMWDWTKIDGVWQRRVSGTLTRPIAGWIEDGSRATELMKDLKGPEGEDRKMAH